MRFEVRSYRGTKVREFPGSILDCELFHWFLLLHWHPGQLQDHLHQREDWRGNQGCQINREILHQGTVHDWRSGNIAFRYDRCAVWRWIGFQSVWSIEIGACPQTKQDYHVSEVNRRIQGIPKIEQARFPVSNVLTLLRLHLVDDCVVRGVVDSSNEF